MNWLTKLYYQSFKRYRRLEFRAVSYSEGDRLIRESAGKPEPEQRKELLRVILTRFNDDKVRKVSAEEAATMTDRQLTLTWLYMCEYISEELYRREFDACIGKSLFEDTGNPS